MIPNDGMHNGAHPGTLEIRLGRRKSDVTITFGWAMKRGLVKCNVAYVEGIFLEEIPSRLIPKTTIRDGYKAPQVVYDKIQMGIVLVNQKWGNQLFFVCEHEGWTEDEYFEAADLLIQGKKRADENFESKND